MNGKNIFGKTINDYQHLKALKKAGMLDDHLAGYEQVFNKPAFVKDSVFVRDDATALQYMISNTMYLMTEIEEVLYLNYRLPSFVPVRSDIPEGANSYAYRVVDKVGTAGFIDTMGTNASTASVSQRLISSIILQGGIDVEWSMQDMRNAMFSGTPLDTLLLQSGTKACLNHIEGVGLLGDKTRGWTGLINNDDIPVQTTATALEQSTDPAELINLYINQIIKLTNEIFGRVITTGMTLYLPVDQYSFLATKKYDLNATKSVMDFLMMFNAWTTRTGAPLKFESVIELAGAGAGGKDRMLIAFNNNEVMEMANPITPRVINLIDKGRSIFAPMEYSLSPLNFKQPQACLYVDFAAPTPSP